jgi:sialate O-acetylesterase
MVLQREHVIPVWGNSYPDSNVIVTITSNSETTQADSNGNWFVELPAMNAGGPYSMTIESGGQQISITDVYIGDVWLASGQSNMELQVSNADSASATIASANDPEIRQFKIPKGLSDEPSDELPSGSVWTPATSQYVGNFTAVGYFFALNLKPHIDVPIGIINSSYGGSRIETWMTDDMLGFDEQDTVLAGGEAERQPTVAYNKMIHSILQYPIKGVIWYQGESNGDSMEDALAYGELFKTFIEGWRNLWNEGDFPFLWVQLPNYGEIYDEPAIWDAWPQLRAGQSSALSLPNTGEAVTIDVGDVDIHPTYKQPVGYRLSLVARKIAYGEDIVYSGPRYRSNFLREDGKIEINFDYIGSGLTAKGSESGEVIGFAVAGDDDQLAWANAVIDGEQVLVWNDEIPEPAIVRYAWEYNPAGVNLYNAEGLPAAPFLANVNPGFKIAVFESARTAIEQNQSTTLSWLVFNALSVTLDGEHVDTSGTKVVSPAETTTYTLIAVNRDDETETDTAKVTITVLDPNQINRATNKTVSASTFEACCGDELIPELAVDGDMETRWSSAWQIGDDSTLPDPNLDDDPDDEWISVDLGEAIDIDRIILYWEAAYGSEYDIELSYDGYIWNTVYEERSGDGGEDNITFDTLQSGRFVRMHGIDRATQYGYSIYEIAVYGLIAAKSPPEVDVEPELGNVVASGEDVKLIAEATDTDGTVEQVSFYVDGELIETLDSSPFETSWTAGENEEYEITAVVTDNDGLSVQSEPLIIYINDGTTTRFEAEDAAWTGQGTVTNSGETSGGAYLEMRDAWTLTFDNINVPETGDYLLIIAYQLTFESPKTQFLVVNGDTLEAVEFIAFSTSAWLKRGIEIPLNSGANTIAFHGYWNWMSFDYIDIPGATIVEVDEMPVVPSSYSLSNNYPNPFNPATKINYSIPEKTHVSLKVFDILGKQVATLVNKEQSAGYYKIEFDASKFASGVYFYKLHAGDFIENRKMILLR